MAESKYPKLYHATQNDFSQFRLNGDISEGVNRDNGSSNSDGVGIYLFSKQSSARGSTNGFYESFQFENKYLTNPELEKHFSEQNLDRTPYFEGLKTIPATEWHLYGGKRCISMDGFTVDKELYVKYFTEKWQVTEKRDVSQAINLCIRANRPLSKEELTKLLMENNVSNQNIETLINHFSGKEIKEKLLLKKFKGRILRVRIADDCKLFDKSKTVAENGITYDFDGICNFIEENPDKNPTAFAEMLRKFNIGPEMSSSLKQQATQLIQEYEQALPQVLTDDLINGENKTAIIKNKLITQSKKMLSQLLDSLTYDEIRDCSLVLCANRTGKTGKAIPPEVQQKLSKIGVNKYQARREALGILFNYDGVISPNAPGYGQDIYFVRNLEKLTIEAYKPYGSDKWIPIEPPKKKELTPTERLARYRCGGIEA